MEVAEAQRRALCVEGFHDRRSVGEKSSVEPLQSKLGRPTGFLQILIRCFQQPKIVPMMSSPSHEQPRKLLGPK